jgi:hypothetical protein
MLLETYPPKINKHAWKGDNLFIKPYASLES